MENENNQDQTLELENETIEEELLDDDEKVEDDNHEVVEDDEEVIDLEKFKSLERQNKALRDDLVKARKGNKSSKKPLQKTQKSTGTSKEDIIFYSSLTQKGLNADDIEEVEKIASGFGVTRNEAVNHYAFKAYQEDKKQKEVSNAASMSASRGSKKARQDKSLSDSGLTDKEHEQLAMKKFQERKGR